MSAVNAFTALTPLRGYSYYRSAGLAPWAKVFRPYGTGAYPVSKIQIDTRYVLYRALAQRERPLACRQLHIHTQLHLGGVGLDVGCHQIALFRFFRPAEVC